MGGKLGFLGHEELALPDPAPMGGKDGVAADVEASAGDSRFGLVNGSEGGGRLLDGGCWMVCIVCAASIDG